MTCQRPQYGKHVTRYQLGDRSRASIVSWLRDKAKAQVSRHLSHSQSNDVAHCWNCLTIPSFVMNRAYYSMGGSVENHEEICWVIIAIYVTLLWKSKGKIVTVRNKDNDKARCSSCCSSLFRYCIHTRSGDLIALCPLVSGEKRCRILKLSTCLKSFGELKNTRFLTCARTLLWQNTRTP